MVGSFSLKAMIMWEEVIWLPDFAIVPKWSGLAPKELVSPLMDLNQIELGEVLVDGFAKPFQLVQLEQAE